MFKKISTPITILLMSVVPHVAQAVPFAVFKRPTYELSMEALWAQRKGVRKRPLVIDLAQVKKVNTGVVLSSTKLMNHFPWEAGFKVAFDYTPDVDRSVEFVYSWLREWEAKNTFKNSLFAYPFSFDTVDYATASMVEANYRSHFWDAEINYWAHLTPRGGNYFSVSAIGGFRGMYLGEHIKLTYTTEEAVSDTEFELSSSSYIGKTKNRIAGIQAGGNLQWNPVHHWTWELTAKGGVMIDWSSVDTIFGDNNNTEIQSVSNGPKSAATYLLDGDLHLYYHRQKGCFDIGYRMLGLWSVALAPNQLTTFAPGPLPNRLHHQSKTYFHIVSVGLKFLF